jgi:hypothetical protein
VSLFYWDGKAGQRRCHGELLPSVRMKHQTRSKGKGCRGSFDKVALSLDAAVPEAASYLQVLITSLFFFLKQDLTM